MTQSPQSSTPPVAKAALLSLYREMLVIRRTEEQLAKSHQQGLIHGACHTYVGEEAIATGVCAHLRPDDAVFSTHRGHGHALAKGVPPRELIAELFGRATGCSRGRGGSMHLFAPEIGLMGTSGIVGPCIMWAEITARMFETVGHEVPVVGELVTGERTRTVAYPNGPRRRITQPGDAALMDVSQRIDGYWSDCTNTHVIGGVAPTAEQRRYAKAAQAACEAAMAALRPGARACDAWAAADRAFQSYGLQTAHYAGHQIGVTVNELPRLVPYDETVVEAGMVFSVEPGVYQGPDGDFGARAEKMVLVTASGPEILSQFEWGVV